MAQGGKFVGGRVRLSEALIEFPIAALNALDPAAYKGRIVLADDGNLWHSDGSAWKLNQTAGELSESVVTRTDEIFLEEYEQGSFPSASENYRRMIYDSTAGVPRISDGTAWESVVEFANTARHELPPTLVTVGSGGDYATLNAAFEALSNYLIPQGDYDDFLITEVRILDGTTITSPLLLGQKNFRWVKITQESGSTVLVSESALYEHNGLLGNQYWFMWANSITIECEFRLNKSWGAGVTQIDGLDVYGLIATDGFSVINNGGFSNFTHNVTLTLGAGMSVYDANCVDARKRGLWALVGARVHTFDSVIRGDEASIVASEGAGIHTFHNQVANDFRRTSGSDSNQDIVVDKGGYVTLDAEALGGTSQAPNVHTPDGLITREAAGGAIIYDFGGATLTNANVDGLGNGLAGVVVSADQDLVQGQSVVADASGGTLELSLPASLNVGDQFVVLAKGGSVRILANGHTIQFNGTDIGGNLLLSAGQTAHLQADTASSVEIL